MAVTTPPALPAVRTTLSRSVMVAATAFVLAGALRLTTSAEQLGLSLGLAALFFVVAVVQIAFGLLLAIGTPRLTTTPVAYTAMVITLGLIGSWLLVTTTTVPLYPLMNGDFAVDVLDLAAALLELTAIIALGRSLPERTRSRVVWSLVGLVSAAWLAWVVVVVVSGLTN
ncbi:MAG TPA: hypothetical protein VHV49_06125 [Pseudonocardiaceae bacterium]|jgi:hypothetical protein|nr:hypothetical protein [Pseudonocardiaceae bacterium]